MGEGRDASTPRRATLADTRAAVRAMDEGLRGVDAAYDALARSAPRRWLAQQVSLPLYFHWLNEGWVVEAEEQLAGWLFLLHRAQTTHINDIGVAAAWRRQGLGRRLLAWAEARARERGKAALTLAVTVANRPAVALYESSGFRAVHPTLWQGGPRRLPTVLSPLALRELDPAQRLDPFREGWSRALRADGLPADALLADELGAWYTERGRAWELWQGRARVGYADLVDQALRLFVAEPADAALLQAAWSALPVAPLRLDLGSDVADAAVAELLERAGWQKTRRERMAMVKALVQE